MPFSRRSPLTRSRPARLAAERADQPDAAAGGVLRGGRRHRAVQPHLGAVADARVAGRGDEHVRADAEARELHPAVQPGPDHAAAGQHEHAGLLSAAGARLPAGARWRAVALRLLDACARPPPLPPRMPHLRALLLLCGARCRCVAVGWMGMEAWASRRAGAGGERRRPERKGEITNQAWWLLEAAMPRAAPHSGHAPARRVLLSRLVS